MEKAKKSKKKLIAIIAGAAMAFVLTVAVSVGATLAYFGQTKTANAVVTMGQALKFEGEKITATATGSGSLEGVLPGQTVSIDVTGSVVASSTPYYLRVKVDIATGGSITGMAIKSVKVDGQALSAHTDGYYYLTGTDFAGITSASGATHTAVVECTIPASLTNDVAELSSTVNAEMGIIQSQYLVEGTPSLAAIATAWSTATI